MKRVCVFCGSASGNAALYQDAVVDFADALVEQGLGLVYGGAHRGLMGVLADRVLARGGEVIGVIPQRLVELEVAHAGLTELIVVSGMHERKATMAARADAFVALPGGFGTLEELTEVVTWSQLGLHHKPCALFNVAGYFDAFLQFIEHMHATGFVREQHRGLLQVESDPHRLLERLQQPVAP